MSDRHADMKYKSQGEVSVSTVLPNKRMNI